MSSGPTNILIKVGALTADAVHDLGKVNSALGETMTTGQKATAGLKKAALPAAAALGAIGVAAVDATKAALQDAAAQDKLAGQLKRVSGATDAQVKSAEDYITKLELQTGIADDDLRPALGKLATATGDVTKAQDALALAVDISAQTGKSLDTVTTALAKGYGGNTAALGKLVPGLDQATLATKDMHKITAELSDLTAGAASQAANTAAGKYKVWQVQMQELKETIGASLIPVVQQLGTILQSVTAIAAEHTTVIKVAVSVVAGFAAAILTANAAIKAYEAVQVAVKVATAAWTAAQWLLNAALDANPIGIVVIALTALGVGLVAAYNKSETFRNVVHGAMSAVKDVVNDLNLAFDHLKDAALTAFNWIVDHWKIALFAFGPVGAAVYAIATNFDSIQAAAEKTWNWINKYFDFAFGGVISAIDGVTRAFRRVSDAVETVAGWIDRLIDLIGKIHFPHIPDLPFGIGGKSVSGFAAVIPAPSFGRAAPAVGGTSAGGLTVNVYGAVDPEGTARAIRRVLQSHDRRQGRIV